MSLAVAQCVLAAVHGPSIDVPPDGLRFPLPPWGDRGVGRYEQCFQLALHGAAELETLLAVGGGAMGEAAQDRAVLVSVLQRSLFIAPQRTAATPRSVRRPEPVHQWSPCEAQARARSASAKL